MSDMMLSGKHSFCYQFVCTEHGTGNTVVYTVHAGSLVEAVHTFYTGCMYLPPLTVQCVNCLDHGRELELAKNERG